MAHGPIFDYSETDVYRGNRVANKLVAMAMEHLEAIGCTPVVLHPSEAGRRIFTRASASKRQRR
jgi:hypothetical protein